MIKKYLILIATAIFAFASCDELKVLEPETPEAKDSIELSSEAETVGAKGGVKAVFVTSTGDWTLAAKEAYDWVTPSALEGSDAATVKFTVEPNSTEEKVAVFTFTCGEASADFKITSQAEEIVKDKFELISENKVTVSFEKGVLDIKAKTSKGYQSVTAAVSEDAKSWLKASPALQGETSQDAIIKVEYSGLTSLLDREGIITLSSEGFTEKFEINVKQLAKLVLSVDNDAYSIGLEGGDIVIPVNTNVEYTAEIQGDASWFTVVSADKKGVKLNAQKLADGNRKATVVLTQKNPATGTEALKASFNFSQSTLLVRWAADLKSNRIFPKWAVNKPFDEEPGRMSVEALIYINSFKEGTSNNISTLFGVEGQFMVRFGDDGIQGNVLQVSDAESRKFTLDYDFKTKKWYHIAVTYDGYQGQELIIYVNGKRIDSFQLRNSGIPVGRRWSQDEIWVRPSDHERIPSPCWWFGYAWDASRDLDGLMTEIRFWTKVLTPEEIAAPNHFYDVDPSSDKLMSYWKFTEGSGNTVADKSTAKGKVGEPLYGEINVVKGKDAVVRGTEGIKWVEVGLPTE